MGILSCPGAVLLLLLALPMLEGAEDFESTCGQSMVTSSRIVGGQDAQNGAWPWQASIRYRGSHICGGSLITEEWVVSAAHCFTWSSSPSDYSVSLGEFQLDIQSANAFTSAVSQFIIHQNYNRDTFDSDIALVHLKTSLRYTTYILPVCLPDWSNSTTSDAVCWVTGWGSVRTNESLPPPRTLQQVQVLLMDAQTCNGLYSKPITGSTGSRPIKDDMLCAGYNEGGKDACQGDSGGPLVCFQPDSWFLIGIVSWGVGCGLAYRPGVYTQVSAYSDWIQQQIPEVKIGTVNVTISSQRNASYAPALNLLLFIAFLLACTAMENSTPLITPPLARSAPGPEKDPGLDAQKFRARTL